MLPESSKGASYPVPVFEFLNVNELSMKQMAFKGEWPSLENLENKDFRDGGRRGIRTPDQRRVKPLR